MIAVQSGGVGGDGGDNDIVVSDGDDVDTVVLR